MAGRVARATFDASRLGHRLQRGPSHQRRSTWAPGRSTARSCPMASTGSALRPSADARAAVRRALGVGDDTAAVFAVGPLRPQERVRVPDRRDRAASPRDGPGRRSSSAVTATCATSTKRGRGQRGWPIASASSAPCRKTMWPATWRRRTSWSCRRCATPPVTSMVCPTSSWRRWRRRRPLVATRAGGIGAVVEDGVNGVIVPEGDIRALADAIGGLMGDRGRGRALGERARQRVLADHGWPKVAERFEAAYARARLLNPRRNS